MSTTYRIKPRSRATDLDARLDELFGPMTPEFQALLDASLAIHAAIDAEMEGVR